MPSSAAAPSPREAARCWLRLGCTPFGDVDVQVARMREELVLRRQWFSDRRFRHARQFCAVLPGSETLALATYLGWLLQGRRGGVAAGLTFVAPSLLAMLLVVASVARFGQAAGIAAMLQSMRPAVVAIVLLAAFRLGTRVLRTPAQWSIAMLVFLATGLFGAPVPLAILVGAAGGALAGRNGSAATASPQPVMTAADPGAGDVDAVIGDAFPLPPHARFRLGQSLAVLAAGVAIATLAYAVLALAFTGHGSEGLELAGFHARATVLWFGHGLAGLPYAWTAAVDQYRWLTGGQMIDVIALALATPGGPAALAAGVGFVAGWNSEFATAGLPLVSAGLGAAIAAAFSLLPSFTLVLAGGPFIEGTRHRVGLQAPLAGIAAAVVGLMAALALRMAAQVLITPAQRFDWIAIAIALAALLLRARLKADATSTMMAAGLTGLLLWAAGHGIPGGG